MSGDSTSSFLPSSLQKNFSEDLRRSLSKPECENYSQFQREFVRLLDLYASKKIKSLRENQKPHVSKVLRKAIMRRSSLKNKAKNPQKLRECFELQTKWKPSCFPE